jgi:hypothetical protein
MAEFFNQDEIDNILGIDDSQFEDEQEVPAELKEKTKKIRDVFKKLFSFITNKHNSSFKLSEPEYMYITKSEFILSVPPQLSAFECDKGDVQICLSVENGFTFKLYEIICDTKLERYGAIGEGEKEFEILDKELFTPLTIFIKKLTQNIDAQESIKYGVDGNTFSLGDDMLLSTYFNISLDGQSLGYIGFTLNENYLKKVKN